MELEDRSKLQKFWHKCLMGGRVGKFSLSFIGTKQWELFSEANYTGESYIMFPEYYQNNVHTQLKTYVMELNTIASIRIVEPAVGRMNHPNNMYTVKNVILYRFKAANKVDWLDIHGHNNQSLKGAVVVTLCKNEADVKCQMDIDSSISLTEQVRSVSLIFPACSEVEIWGKFSLEIILLPHFGRGLCQLLLLIPETSGKNYSVLLPDVICNVFSRQP